MAKVYDQQRFYIRNLIDFRAWRGRIESDSQRKHLIESFMVMVWNNLVNKTNFNLSGKA